MGDAGDIAKPQIGDARRFAAFISYSHADAVAAAKLQRKLERYRLPRRIAETRASADASLGAIFRDREDLAAAASLSTAIRDAIGRAEALVVMCSPDASASPWVAAEIELFRELHPDRPILAALLSGEPAASFPPALTADGNEPLAADLRAEGDGEQLGFLKIVAGIAGVPLDALIQRDAQRRIRRVTAITGGALAAMLVMGIMTTLALQARNEAARQRAAAEGLVEYMLTDLREKLKGVGRLDVMENVNQRAKSYYGGGSVKGRLLGAQVLHAMGEDLDKQGKLEQAEVAFRQSYRDTLVMLKAYPSEAEVVFTHAQSEYWVGYSAKRKGDWKTAKRHWQNYLSHARALAKIEPAKPRSFMELGYAEGNLCEAARAESAELKAALYHCERSVEYEKRALRLAPDDPKIRQDLANRYGWLALVHHKVGDLPSVIEARRKEAGIMSGLLVDDPKNVEYALRYSWAAAGLAAAQIEVKQPEDARAMLRTALKIFDAASTSTSDDERITFARLRLLGYMAKAEISMIERIAPTTASAIEAMMSHHPKRREMGKLFRKIIGEEIQ